MSDPTSTPNNASSEPAASWLQRLWHPGFWGSQLPYALALILTLFGVAYTSVSKNPIIVFWEFLAVVIAVVCIGTGWSHAPEKKTRLRLVWTQALHWLAFLVAMNLVLLPNVQNMLNSDATGLTILLLLAHQDCIGSVARRRRKLAC
jgi:cytochrome b561